MNAGFCKRTIFLAVVISCVLPTATSSLAVPLLNDPNGFEDIPWGTSLAEMEQFARVEDAGRLEIYEQTKQAPALGTIPIDSIRFTTFEKKFGRVTVRYNGSETHERVLTYLQSKYGPLDRTPGQITVGSVKVYVWHGFHTEVALRFETGADRGIIFFESLTLPEKLSDGTSATVF
jgi:hypothetical protein